MRRLVFGALSPAFASLAIILFAIGGVMLFPTRTFAQTGGGYDYPFCYDGPSCGGDCNGAPGLCNTHSCTGTYYCSQRLCGSVLPPYGKCGCK